MAPHMSTVPRRSARRTRFRASRPASSVESASIQDEVHISDTARMVEQVKQAPDIRQDRVQAIRAQIAAGTYETQGKLDGAVSRLLDEIG